MCSNLHVTVKTNMSNCQSLIIVSVEDQNPFLHVTESTYLFYSYHISYSVVAL